MRALVLQDPSSKGAATVRVREKKATVVGEKATVIWPIIGERTDESSGAVT